MELNIKLRSVNEYGGFLYSLEMLKTLRLFKGKKLLSYIVENFDTSDWVDFSASLVTLQFENFYFYMLREESGAVPSTCCQEVFVSSQEMDLPSQERQKYGSLGEIDGKSCDCRNTYAIDKSVDDIILELHTLGPTGKAVEFIDNVILRLGDECFMPCFGPLVCYYYKNKEILHPTLEDCHREMHDLDYSFLKERLKSEGLTEEAISAEMERERNRWKFVSLEEFLSTRTGGINEDEIVV